MSPSDRRIYDLIHEMGTATSEQLHDRLGLWYSYGELYAQLDRLEGEGWIKSQLEEVTDPERLAVRSYRYERLFYVARLPDDP